ncbi:MAG: DUF4251 domain-containing protein [Bacteroidales bacterium]|nr:DUF4251 domain-containing protein [Bacteroidales bacterium]
MKVKIILSLAFIIILNSAYAQGKAEKKEKNKEQYKEIIELLKSGEYNFIANRANSQNGKSINLSSNYFLTISNGIANADLPFFGESYIVNTSTGSAGIKFNDSVSDYEIKEKGKILRVQIRFQVETFQDLYNCTLNVSNSGFADLTIYSRSRSTISYDGKVSAIMK